jgi:hypothetical protein
MRTLDVGQKYVHAPLLWSDFVLSKILQIEGIFWGGGKKKKNMKIL